MKLLKTKLENSNRLLLFGSGSLPTRTLQYNHNLSSTLLFIMKHNFKQL